MKKRVGVRNDVICRTNFEFYKEFHNRFVWIKSPKCVEIKNSTKVNQIKVEETRFGRVNPANDVIHDTQKVIWDENL